MKNHRLFVGNLPFGVGEQQIEEVFERCGSVVEVTIPKDRTSGEQRGFAFVTMASAADAKHAAEQLEGVELGGRKLRVQEAESKPQRERNGYERTGGRGRR